MPGRSPRIRPTACSSCVSAAARSSKSEPRHGHGGMTEPRFFERPEGLTAQEIAALTGAVLRGSADRRIGGIAPLDRASPGDLSFMQSPKYLAQFTATLA